MFQVGDRVVIREGKETYSSEEFHGMSGTVVKCDDHHMTSTDYVYIQLDTPVSDGYKWWVPWQDLDLADTGDPSWEV